MHAVSKLIFVNKHATSVEIGRVILSPQKIRIRTSGENVTLDDIWVEVLGPHSARLYYTKPKAGVAAKFDKLFIGVEKLVEEEEVG